MVYRFVFQILVVENAKYYLTEIMLQMHTTVFGSKICPFLNLLYVIWTELFDYIIDILRTVLETTKIFVRHVYNLLLFSNV